MLVNPQNVRSVTMYPHMDLIGGEGPTFLPVITDGVGTYGIGLLMTSIYYNLDLSSCVFGKDQSFEVHGLYIAMGYYEDGSSFQTPPMLCLEAGATPRFGRTITKNSIIHTDDSAASLNSSTLPKYATLGPLTDITVSRIFVPITSSSNLITNGSGNVIATFFGAPHLMGVEVTKGDRVGDLQEGMKGIIISGKQKDGKTVTYSNLTCISAGQPAVFLHEFPG